MIKVLVGHRGVGKTQFLSRIKSYYQNLNLTCHIFDLDQEIENNFGESISFIFQNYGEKYFREIEQKTLENLFERAASLPGAVYIAVGAGYLGSFPHAVQVIWVRRDLDRAGRVFIDRPRLDNEITPLAEFMNRFEIRESRFKSISDYEITLGEGWDQINASEPVLLGLKPANTGAFVTVLPEHVSRPERLSYELNRWLQLGVSHIELRDDLLTFDTIEEILPLVPSEKVLITFRRPEPDPRLVQLSGPYKTDWAIELGPSPFSHNFIVSVHTRLAGELIEETAQRLTSAKADHYKMAIPIENFLELWAGHNFFLENQSQHSFLPCSLNGRWKWYRLLHRGRMKINFVRDGQGSAADQPTFFDYLQSAENENGFAAILGDPVAHSHTPVEQYEFFKKQKMSVQAVQMSEEECNQINLGILDRLGLKAAAVTSPLKTKMARVCSHVTRLAEELNSVNTIIKLPSGWLGTNTDVIGLKSIFNSLDLADEIAVWGGGGTRLALKSILPKAHFFSARRGQEIWTQNSHPVFPEAVIWALGRQRISNTQPVPTNWRPKYVFDLNYSEDSPGLEYAVQVGAKYISGKAMFKSQAQAQREFWSERLEAR